MNVNERMITLAREGAGLTQSALAHAAGISQALLSKIEHGLDVPNEDVLTTLAEECHVPVEFFLQQDQILGEGIVDFFHRKRQTLPAKPLRQAHAMVNIARLEILRVLRTLALTDLAPFPVTPADDTPPAEAARFVRATWRLQPGPLPNLVALIEAAGIPVLLMDLGHEKLSAISMPSIDGAPVIVLNRQLPASHQRWSLAHDLGHLVMHTGSPTDDMERDADRFASELLMPARDIHPQLRNLRFSDLGTLKPLWRVSLAALMRTAHDLGQITDRQYRTWNMRLNQLPEGRKREPGEFQREEPRLIRHILEHYQSDLGYTASDLAKLMVTTEDKMREQYFGEPPTRTLRVVNRGDAALHRVSAPGAPRDQRA